MSNGSHLIKWTERYVHFENVIDDRNWDGWDMDISMEIEKIEDWPETHNY